MSHPQPAIGIDFGTTNSSVALAHPNGHVDLVTFPTTSTPTESYRSILYLEQLKQAGRNSLKSFTGPSGIEHYLAAENKGRLIQSLKSYLPSRNLTGTEVFGRRYTIEDLISRILSDLRARAEIHLDRPIRHATVGRPVRFVGSDSDEDDAFALDRLRSAFTHAGFESVTFELEPIAAAYAYESTLDHDELILIGDFGGGTSDFSLVKVGPNTRSLDRAQRILGNSGLGLAGDAFDARIVRKLVSPALGSDSLEREMNHKSGPLKPTSPRPPEKRLPAVPAWIYANLERWHYLSFLKTRNVTELLRSARVRAAEPEKIVGLITLIDEDLGYQLHQAVQRLKIDLSRHETSPFKFRDGSMEIESQVARTDFESWISDQLQSIETCVDGLLTASNIAPQDVDRVFLTGGTSFVPAVRRIFESRFTADRVVTGNEFTSVARGLALRALEAYRS
ncbi:Hsp70 family protein [Granulicella sp. dw_53]|uniref:Hsp70 family protein n=1 Tax=Granulicella sp. dw_53 TaxID=2719792 RepID=UPI001BD340A3|nr:Hsp70 family protein [Granulicella sp. dw_53]